jgi:riboflavin transporter FmnP
MKIKKKLDLKTLTVLGVLCAIAYILASLIRIPLVPAVGFLGYEPKDVVFVIAGFLYGPFAPLVMAAVIALLEGFTTSVMGPIGIPMNFIASVTFGCTASIVYRKWHTIEGAVVGLTLSVVLTTGVMLLWNYALTPILMGIPRHVVEAMLIPGFLPFNLIKCTLNAAIIMLLYKPIRKALEMSRLLPVSAEPDAKPAKISIGVLLVSAFILITCIVVVLSWQGII